MNELPFYVVVVSHNSYQSTIQLVDNFNRAINESSVPAILIVVENSNNPLLSEEMFSKMDGVKYLYYPIANKSKTLNYVIGTEIKEEETLILCLDDDISFELDFLQKFYQNATAGGDQFFYGGGLKVNKSDSFDAAIQDYYQGSILGKGDEEFLKSKSPTFFGCNYGFYKSQWERVNGLDERFAPGATTGLKGDESVFQKKLKHVGYLPYYIPDNYVVHHATDELYTLKAVLKRQYDNAFTHGYQLLILNQSAILHFRKSFYLLRRVLLHLVKCNWKDLKIKSSFLRGHINSYFYYLRSKDNRTYLNE